MNTSTPAAMLVEDIAHYVATLSRGWSYVTEVEIYSRKYPKHRLMCVVFHIKNSFAIQWNLDYWLTELLIIRTANWLLC